jgi:hypothetical protein
MREEKRQLAKNSMIASTDKRKNLGKISCHKRVATTPFRQATCARQSARP